MKLKKGRLGGTQFGTLDPLMDFKPNATPFKGRSQSVVQGGHERPEENDNSNIKQKKQNREFKRVTPSVRDLDIKKLIGKYPVNQH